MENHRLMRWSRRLRRLLWLAAALLIGAALLRWFVGPDVRVWPPPTLAAEAPRGPLPTSLRIAGFCLELLPLAAAISSFREAWPRHYGHTISELWRTFQALQSAKANNPHIANTQNVLATYTQK